MADRLRCGDGAELKGWQLAIFASVVLWVATLAGNAALFAVRPATHWPVLETLETLQVASLIPIAIVLHRLNQRSSLSLAITTIGVVAMLVGVAIDIGFVTELWTYGKGPVGGLGFYVFEIAVLIWLLAANALALRDRTLPRNLAIVGAATAATGFLLFPVWAIWLAHDLAAAYPAPPSSESSG